MSNTFSKTKMENHTGRYPTSFCSRGRETDGEKIARGPQRRQETHMEDTRQGQSFSERRHWGGNLRLPRSSAHRLSSRARGLEGRSCGQQNFPGKRAPVPVTVPKAHAKGGYLAIPRTLYSWLFSY